MAEEKNYLWAPYLKGVGQIMLQENAWTGLLFLIGIAINSPLMALGAIVATVVGTLTAGMLKYDPAHINMGLYGFNATLVGVSLLFFFQPTWLIWLTIIVFSALSSIIMNFFLRKKLPAFTFPFIFLVWIALFVFNRVYPTTPIPPSEYHDLINAPFSLLGHGLGFGEVIFQGSLISGIIFFIAIYINSPNSALYALLGTVLCALIAILLKNSLDDVKVGAFGYNAVLTAIALSGTRRIDGLYVFIGVVLTGLIELLMIRWGLSVLTFPFVLATWLMLILRDVLLKKHTP